MSERDGNANDPSERQRWTQWAERLAAPVLEALAAGQLRALMPLEHHPDVSPASRRACMHLEAVGRLLAGISPWLAGGDPAARRLAKLATRGIAMAVDPQSPAALNFCEGGQPLVDAAFLAQAILRAPSLLWEPLPPAARSNLVAAMKSTRRIKPGANNWLLFSAMIEAFLSLAGEDWDAMRVDYALRQHEQWYKGGGAYGDGPEFHFDYYNSFVIHPMLLDVLGEVNRRRDDWSSMVEPVLKRAQHYATVLERLIAPDGSFAAIGRSLAYRCGAFHLLAQLALGHKLPAALPPGQVRTALTAVIARTLDAPGTFDPAGWLRIGLCGHQPCIGESYISTGSLYLCAAALLPLGLEASDPFWQAPARAFTGQRIWGGQFAPTEPAL